MLEGIPVGEGEQGACARWAGEAVGRLSGGVGGEGEGPVLECEDPGAWMDEIMMWAREASLRCGGVVGEVVIKESTKCRVWKSDRRGGGGGGAGGDIERGVQAVI